MSFYAWMKKFGPLRNDAENRDPPLSKSPISTQIEVETPKEIHHELDHIDEFKAGNPISQFAKKFNCSEDEVVSFIAEWKKKNRR